MEGVLAYLDKRIQEECLEKGFEHIQGTLTQEGSAITFNRCAFSLGQYLFLSLLDHWGQAALSSAFHALQLSWDELLDSDEFGPANATDRMNMTEEHIYRIFLEHTPPGLEEEFRDLYRRIHGGPFIDG